MTTPSPVTEEEIERALDKLDRAALGSPLRALGLPEGLPLPPSQFAGDLARIIRHLRSLTEWRSIESAPKDGTELIVYDPDNVPPVFTASCDDDTNEWACSVEGRNADKDDYFGDPPKHPIRWMPLPTPDKTR